MKNRIFALLLLCIAGSSCLKEKLEEGYNKQEANIDSYIAKNTTSDSMRVVYNGGATRLVRIEGTGPMLEPDGSVSFYYAGYIFSGSIDKKNLFVTNHQETAESSNFTLTDPDYSLYEINLGKTELIEGLRDGLIGVRAGERCDILFSGKHAFGNSVFGTIPANSALAFQIWVVGVSND